MDSVELVRSIARRYDIPENLAVRTVQQESGFNPDAVSPDGASGLMQVMPGTAADPGYGVRPLSEDQLFDQEANVEFGMQYLRAMYDKFGSWDLALAAYNAGPGAVEEAGGVPNIEETQNYVASILGSEDIARPMGTVDERGLFGTPEGLAMLREERDPEAGMRMVYQMLQRQRAQESSVQAPAPTAQVQPGRRSGYQEGGSVEASVFQASMMGRHPQNLGYMPRQEDFGPRPAVLPGNLTPLSTSFTPIKMASSAEPSEALDGYGEYLTETYVEPMQQKVEDFVSGIQNNEQRTFGNGAMGIGGLAGFRPPQTLGEIQRYPMVAQGPVGPFMGRIPNYFMSRIEQGYPQSQLRSGIGGMGMMM